MIITKHFKILIIIISLILIAGCINVEEGEGHCNGKIYNKTLFACGWDNKLIPIEYARDCYNWGHHWYDIRKDSCVRAQKPDNTSYNIYPGLNRIWCSYDSNEVCPSNYECCADGGCYDPSKYQCIRI